ncbi:MAG: hypothetical protein IJW46_05865 [Clostridia bacterium]|nr:hypothetical protein [Clostridia bacterium]
MMLDYLFPTEPAYLLTLHAEQDQAEVAPYLHALSRSYRHYAIASPIDNFFGDGVTAVLEHASVAVAFLSPHFFQDEILRSALRHLAISDIPILLVYLEETPLTAGMQLQLSLCPVFYPKRHPSVESAVKTLVNAPFLREALLQS